MPTWENPEKEARRRLRDARVFDDLPPRFDWTDESKKRLRDLFTNDGFSASRIASVLGHGLSRCAVSGMLFRMNILRSKTAQSNIPPRRAAPKPKRHRAFAPEPASAAAPPNYEPTFERDEMNDLPPDQSPNAVALFDAADDQCRWPLGDTKSADFKFCGTTATHGAYCLRHARMAYKPSRSEDRVSR